MGALSHLPFPDSTSDLEFLKRRNKCRSRNEGCEKVHQTDSNPGPHDQKRNTLTTRLPTAAADRRKIFGIYALINVYVAGPDSDQKYPFSISRFHIVFSVSHLIYPYYSLNSMLKYRKNFQDIESKWLFLLNYTGNQWCCLIFSAKFREKDRQHYKQNSR